MKKTKKETDLATLGGRLRYLRKRTGFTQEKVAEDCHLDYSTYGRYERGSIKPSLETIESLAKLLNCQPGYIAFGTQDATADLKNELLDYLKDIIQRLE